MPAELPSTAASVFDEIRDALAAPAGAAPPAEVPLAAALSPASPELDRRLAGLERLLQVLLTELGRADRDLLVRLQDAFAASSVGAGTDEDKAAGAAGLALLDAARRAAGERAEPREASEACRPAADPRPAERPHDQSAFRPPSFHYQKVGGIWRLTMDRSRRPVAADKKR